METSSLTRCFVQYLTSTDPTLRIMAWDELFQKYYDYWYRAFFYGKYGQRGIKGVYNKQDADDLLHEMYFKIRRRIIEKPLGDTNINSYLWRTQYTMLVDYWRIQANNQRRFIPLGRQTANAGDHVIDHAQWQYLEEAFNRKMLSVEEQLGLKWSYKQTIDLGMRVLKPKDRVLLTLIGVQQFTAYQAHCLMGLSLRGCYRHFDKITNLLGMQWPVAASLANRSFDWMNELNLEATQTGISVFLLNANFINLSPESRQLLCQTLNVKTAAELAEQYYASLLIHGIDTPEPASRIVFLPKRDLNADLLTGHKIHYLEFAPVFDQVRVNGKSQEHLFLLKTSEYTGRATRTYTNPHTGLSGIEFFYDLPTGPINIYKCITPQFNQLLRQKNFNDEIFLASAPYPADMSSQGNPSLQTVDHPADPVWA